MALTIIELRAGEAEKVKAALATNPPSMSQRQYLNLQDSRRTAEL
jgi:hypothetical protein